MQLNYKLNKIKKEMIKKKTTTLISESVGKMFELDLIPEVFAWCVKSNGLEMTPKSSLQFDEVQSVIEDTWREVGE